MKPKTIAIIPARGGSKRLPDKNLKILGNLSLLAHSIIFAQANSHIIDQIFVTTDSELIKKEALKYGVNVIDRPKELAGDDEPTITALQHALLQLDDEIENVILLQPTNPLRPQQLLTDAFKIFQENHYDSLFTVSRNHQKLGKILNNTFVPYNYTLGQRSQDLEPLFYENGLLYITKASLIQKGLIIAPKAFPYEINHLFATIDIDTMEDLELAECIVRDFQRKNK